jgi:hypothetical protein
MLEQKGSFDNFLSNAVENRNYMIETNRNEGTGKIIGGSLQALFAFLIMWGGNRTRRPKEVRIKHDSISIWSCHNCKMRGDKSFMEQHECRGKGKGETPR